MILFTSFTINRWSLEDSPANGRKLMWLQFTNLDPHTTPQTTAQFPNSALQPKYWIASLLTKWWKNSTAPSSPNNTDSSAKGQQSPTCSITQRHSNEALTQGARWTWLTLISQRPLIKSTTISCFINCKIWESAESSLTGLNPTSKEDHKPLRWVSACHLNLMYLLQSFKDLILVRCCSHFSSTTSETLLKM